MENKPSTGLFIHNLESEEQVRAIFSEEDKWRIVRVEKYGRTNHVVHFNTHEEAKAALDRQPLEHKRSQGNQAPGQQRKPNVKWFDARGKPASTNSNRENQGNQGAGTWQGSNRGGAANSSGPRPGYQSGASDSEGVGAGRGRGFGNRGDRGGQNRGRGNRGRGRGGPGKSGGEEASASNATTSTPSAPASSEKA